MSCAPGEATSAVDRPFAGDALETLAPDEGAIDFLFLDGWNDLGVKAFLARLRALTGFVSSLIESDKGAMEVACFVGPWEPLA